MKYQRQPFVSLGKALTNESVYVMKTISQVPVHTKRKSDFISLLLVKILPNPSDKERKFTHKSDLL